MRAVFSLVLVVGIALAGFAVYMVNGYVSETQFALDVERQRALQATPTVEVLAVNRAIAYGETLTLEDVETIKYAEPFLPEGVFTTMEELFPEGDEALRVVTRPMEINEPIMAVKVTEPGEIVGITALLDPGMSAFTIAVDVQSGVSGFLRPGDRVDVYWSGNLRTAGGENENVTQLIMQSLQLIAIDQTSDGNRNGASIARTVTVQAKPESILALTQAQSTGKLSLALVGSGDTTVVGGLSINQRTLLGIPEEVEEIVEEVAPVVAPAPPPPPPKVCTIKNRRGAEIVEVVIDCPE